MIIDEDIMENFITDVLDCSIDEAKEILDKLYSPLYQYGSYSARNLKNTYACQIVDILTSDIMSKLFEHTRRFIKTNPAVFLTIPDGTIRVELTDEQCQFINDFMDSKEVDKVVLGNLFLDWDNDLQANVVLFIDYLFDNGYFTEPLKVGDKVVVKDIDKQTDLTYNDEILDDMVWIVESVNPVEQTVGLLRQADRADNYCYNEFLFSDLVKTRG